MAQFLFSLLIGAAIVLGPTSAQANPRYAAMVVDAKSGKVLFARNADARRYPASLTKIMTLYMLFDAMERGEVTLQTKMKVSKRAAGQAPSKLGLVAGETITAELAIHALAVKSANDVATVVAEHLGETEYRFAQLMTKRARQIGMQRTTFQNASGLPDSNQITTARDMATLSRRLISDHPTYYAYFSVPSFKYKGRRYTAHNALLKDFRGTDGIKTGYIRASGFNLTSSVRRNGVHLIGVVFGGRTKYTRDAHMRKILTQQFGRVASDPSLVKRFTVIPKPVPKPGTEMALIASLSAAPQQRTVAAASTGLESMIEQGDAADFGAVVGDGQSIKTFQDGAFVERDDPIGDLIVSDRSAALDALPGFQTSTPLPGEPAAPKAFVLSALGDDAAAQKRRQKRLANKDAFYGVQIGAYGVEAIARERLNAAAEKAPEIFKDVIFAIAPIEVNDRLVYRARIGPYREDEAKLACSVLQQRGVACFPVVQEDWPQ